MPSYLAGKVKKDNRRKAEQHIKILSRSTKAFPSAYKNIMPCLMPFDEKLRHLSSHESVDGR